MLHHSGRNHGIEIGVNRHIFTRSGKIWIQHKPGYRLSKSMGPSTWTLAADTMEQQASSNPVTTDIRCKLASGWDDDLLAPSVSVNTIDTLLKSKLPTSKGKPMSDEPGLGLNKAVTASANP